jgi:3-hydroxyisobutyrate dehydrogenase
MKPTTGFVGLGNMGWPMAQNLCAAGRDLVVHDADPARRDAFAAEYGCEAAAAAEAFTGAEIVVTMLPTGRDVRDVLLAWSGGLAGALAPGALVVDMSSSDPPGTRELGAELAEQGIVLVDAPVSGGVPRAETGMLAIMLGETTSGRSSERHPSWRSSASESFGPARSDPVTR